MKHIGKPGDRVKHVNGNYGTIKSYGEVVGEMVVLFDGESVSKGISTKDLTSSTSETEQSEQPPIDYKCEALKIKLDRRTN